ncbi:MAG: NAD(P)H-dependent oxidoreductase [Chitinophagaceae bacterium]|nr:NAD(P)H-dependent oxidoreductase [Oligoflexus sp.]
MLSTGGPDSAYIRSGYNRFTLNELLRPFEATAVLCGWNYHQPFVVQGVNSIDANQLHAFGERYRQLIERYITEGARVLERLDTSTHS